MPKYDLIGIDGNAFNILGYVTNAMRRRLRLFTRLCDSKD